MQWVENKLCIKLDSPVAQLTETNERLMHGRRNGYQKRSQAKERAHMI